MMSFAIPGTVIGVAYILAFNVPPVSLTGTGTIIAIAFAFRNMPVGIRAGLANLSQIDRSLDEASLTLGSRSFGTLMRVILPMLRPAIVTAMVYSFVRAVTAVSAVIFLVTGHYNLATVYIVGRADVGEYGVAIVYSAMLVVFMMLVLILIQVAGRRTPHRPPCRGASRSRRRASHWCRHDGRTRPAVEFRAVSKRYGDGDRARHRQLWHRTRHAGDAARPVRLRQDDDPAADRRAGAGVARADPDRRRRRHAAVGGRTRRVDGVPVLCAVSAHDGAGECLLRLARVRDAQGAGGARWRRRSSTLVGLAGYGARLPSELSGGQQQRVAVARAIVLEPKVLLFDEPLSNLDAKLRRRVREEIRELQQSLSLTAVYVTHDQQEALAISDRIMVMSMARIAQDGTPREPVRSSRIAISSPTSSATPTSCR